MPCLVNRDRGRYFSEDHVLDEGQSLEDACFLVASLHDANGFGKLHAESKETLFQPVGSRGQCLNGQVVSVAIDDQRWDAVGLAMHPTISGGRRQ